MGAANITKRLMDRLRREHRNIAVDHANAKSRVAAEERRARLLRFERLYYQQVARGFITLALAKCNEQGMEWWAVVGVDDGCDYLKNTGETAVRELVEWLTQCGEGGVFLENASTKQRVAFRFLWQDVQADQLLIDFSHSLGAEETAGEFFEAFTLKFED